jgi:hypothetical protein
MSQLKRRLENLRRPHLGPGKRRNIIAMALVVAVVGLSVYFLLGSGTPSATTTADSDGSGGQVVQSGSSGVRHTCAHPAIVPMDRENAQSGVTKGKYYVTNDTWNLANYVGLSQQLFVCNYNSWYAIATMNNGTGDFAVKTSPNVQQTWYPTPTKLSSWKSITSQFSDIPPGIGSNYGIWEFEYDVWLNGLADSGSTEVMIWTYNNGQTPLGSPSGSFTDGGRTYEVYHSSPPRQYIAFVDRRNNLSGRVNLLDFFNYVISKGWMPRSSTLYQICHGVELVSTNSRSEKFTINNFSINMATHS